MTAPMPLRQSAEELSGTLPALVVAAERVAMTVAQGVHGRRRVGQGEAFWQFRRYEAGDSITRIDWRQTAKRERVFVRETEWEASQTIYVWRDASASMRWRSSAALPEKSARADLLTLALIALLVRGGERAALIGEDQRPSIGRGALARFAERILRSKDGPGLPPSTPLPRHAQAVLIGDFLSPLPQIDAAIRAIATRGIAGHVMQVTDPAEENLPYSGRTRFEGLEHEGDALIPRVESVRADYQRRFADHRAGLADIARAVGWTYMSHRTDRPAELALLTLYLALAHGPEAIGPGGGADGAPA
ncbi:MAG: DUF58 domain-containing protein [Alphaproteobacteria bacterium]|nr:DUF58 domain-containing protein [Alphaproteobacteria bacterium]